MSKENYKNIYRVCCGASALLIAGAISSGSAMICSSIDSNILNDESIQMFEGVKATKSYQDWIIAREQELYSAFKNGLLEVTEFNNKMNYLRSFDYFMKVKDNIIDENTSVQLDDNQSQIDKLDMVSSISSLAVIGSVIGSIGTAVGAVNAKEKAKEKESLEMFLDD